VYEIQGRSREHGPDGKVHEVVRLEKAPSPAAAFAIAETMAADNLRVWVFETTRRATGTRSYRLLHVGGAGGSSF
jgi:hypothetical protein